MGLKQTPPPAAPGAAAPDAPVIDHAADTAAAEQAAAEAAQAAAAEEKDKEKDKEKEDKPKKVKGKTLHLLAVHRPISDPMSGVTYDINMPKPGVVKEGNWLHAQMVAGILKEYVHPGLTEGDEE